jgi:hypothetical protein
MKFFRRIFAASDRNTFVDLFLGALKQSQPNGKFQYREEDFAVQSPNGRINLVNFYAEYCQLPWHKRKAFIQRTVGVFTTVRDELPEDFEEARQNLMPKIWMRSSFAHQALMCQIEGNSPPDLDFQPLGEHLLTTIVYDLPESMQTIPPKQFETWDISSYEAWEIAIENLASRTKAMAKIGDHMVSAVSGDNYDANRLFLVDRLRELGMDGHLVAMVPNRDTLYVTQTHDPVGLKMMAELSDAALQNEPRPMSPFPLQHVDGEWIDWHPPVNHVLYPKFQEMRARYLQGEYAEQKALIEKIQEREAPPSPFEAFVATYSVLQKKDSAEILSYAVWGDGVDTLLPETDRVVLVRSREKPEGFVPWSRVREVMGDDMVEVPDLYPKRFRVRLFPTDDQLAEMEPAEGP